VDVRHAEGTDLAGQLGVVGDDQADVEVELLAARAPQQVEQAVVVAADHDRRALGQARVGEGPLHRKRPADLGGEALLELLAHRLQAGAMEDHPQEEAPAGRVGRVLAGLGDVRAKLEEKLRHGGDDARPIRARDQEPAHVRGVVAARHADECSPPRRRTVRRVKLPPSAR
jgi:hypothetical protein